MTFPERDQPLRCDFDDVLGKREKKPDILYIRNSIDLVTSTTLLHIYSSCK